jgi:Xaa-Pro aminopeptidase
MHKPPTRRDFVGGLAMGGLYGGLLAPGIGLPRNPFIGGSSPPSMPGDSPFPRPPISISAFQQRIARVRRQMEASKLDCLLVSSVVNHAVRYFGFFDPELQGRGSGSPQLVSVLLPLDGDPVLFLQSFTAADYMQRRAHASSYIKDVRLVGGDNQALLQLVAEQLKSWKLDAASLGLAGGEIEWAERLFFASAAPRLNLVNATPMLDKLRIVKDSEEIELMRQSAAIGDAAMVEIEKHIRPGVTDFELYARGQASMISAGGEEDTFVLMGIGPNDNTMLMEILNGRSLRPGSVVVYEALPFYHLYNTELAVTFSVGPVNAMQQKAAAACQAAYEAGVGEAKPGVATAQVVGAALRAFREHGFEEFTHSAGHFMGLDNYEGPPLRSPDLTLEPGMIFSFHPNVVIAGQVKEEICGTLLVTDKGVQNLSKYPPQGIRAI